MAGMLQRLGALVGLGRSMGTIKPAHAAADQFSRELGSWNPAIRTPDAALLPEWKTLVARTNDMVRNHGIASGAVQTHLDNVIGAGLRPIPKPDYRTLGIDAEAAHDWARTTGAKFRNYAEDPDCFIDAGRRMQFNGILAQGFRSYLTWTEILSTSEWLPRVGARYASAVQSLIPDLLCNPMGEPDSWRMRAGVEMDSATSAPIAYHLRQAHVSDGIFSGAPSYVWKRVPAYTPWGRRNVFHVFDVEEPGQTRGRPGCVAVLAKLKMLDKFETVAMQNSIINAMYAAVIESSLDHSIVAEAIGASDNSSPLMTYLGAQGSFHKEHTVNFDGVKIPHLLPGEKLNLMTPQNQGAAFNQFEEGVLRHIAAGWNLSYEQLSRDYSKTNYSSARAAMLEAWKFFLGRRTLIASRYASMIYIAWLEEAIDLGDVVLPKGAPGFYEAKSAWTRCLWIGAPRGHIDPLKEGEADALLYDKNVMSLEEWAASRGLDWEEVLEQKARELAKFKELKLPLPISGNAPKDPGATAPQSYPSDPQPEERTARAA